MKNILVFDEDKLLATSLNNNEFGSFCFDVVVDEKTARYAIGTESYDAIIVNANRSKNQLYSKVLDAIDEKNDLPVVFLVPDDKVCMHECLFYCALLHKPVSPQVICQKLVRLLEEAEVPIAI